MKVVFVAQIKNGNLSLGSEHNKQRFKRFLEGNEGKTLRIVESDKPLRSINQSKFYWLYLELIERELGQDAKSLHEWAKRKFLPAKFIKVMGGDIRIPGSTTDLTKGEFSDYMDRICAECGVPIPNPEEAGYQTTWRAPKPMNNYPTEELQEQIL